MKKLRRVKVYHCNPSPRISAAEVKRVVLKHGYAISLADAKYAYKKARDFSPYVTLERVVSYAVRMAQDRGDPRSNPGKKRTTSEYRAMAKADLRSLRELRDLNRHMARRNK